MKRAFGFCLLLVSHSLAAGYFSDNCSLENEVELETGYRFDQIHFNGPMISPSANGFKKKIDASLWQINLQDRITWNNKCFIQVFGGYGCAYRATDKAYLRVPEYTFGDSTFDIAEPYDNMGAASRLSQQGDLSLPEILSTTTYEAYRRKAHGHAWSFDAALGTTYSWCNVCGIEKFTLEPRIGFTYESLKIKESFHTRLNGGYIGLGFPFSFCNFYIFPDIAYVFAGHRSEDLEIWNDFGSNESFSFHQGNVTGVKSCLSVNYEIYCNLFVGFDWRFFYLKTRNGKYDPSVAVISWKPETSWVSNQFLGTISFNY